MKKSSFHVYLSISIPPRARQTYALHTAHCTVQMLTHTHTRVRGMRKRIKRQPRMISVGKRIHRNRNIMVGYLNLSLFDFIWLTRFSQSEWKWSAFNKTVFHLYENMDCSSSFCFHKVHRQHTSTQAKHTYTVHMHTQRLTRGYMICKLGWLLFAESKSVIRAPHSVEREKILAFSNASTAAANEFHGKKKNKKRTLTNALWFSNR